MGQRGVLDLRFGRAHRPPECVNVTYTIQLAHLPSRTLAVVRRRARPAELAKVVPEACGVVWNALRSQGVLGAGRHVAVYLDDQINLEIGVELDAPFAGHGEVVGSGTPAGAVVTATHRGPYKLLHLAHDAIRAWCRQHGHQLAGPSWEIYGHWQDEWNNDPASIVTDVYHLLAPDAV
jgi:effector-binding domain-containing protein